MWTTAASLAGGEIAVTSVVKDVELPVDLADRKVPLGGLSGLSFETACGLFYAVADDRGDLAPPRVYVLALKGDEWRPRSIEVVTLRDRSGQPFDRGVLDAEGVALAPDGRLWVSTEGITHLNVPPRILGFRLDGTLIDELEVPAHYRQGDGTGGRSNHGFEGLTIAPGGSTIIAAVEAPLIQDGPIADLDRGATTRLVIFDVAAGRAVAERAYRVEPVPDRPVPETAYRSTGVSEILALDEHRILVMERSFSAGVGNRVRLFLADLGTGDDVTGFESLPPDVVTVEKLLVADLADLGVDPDNLEGMTFGPPTPDGRPTLVLIADNNFQPSVQRNQLLVLAVDGVAPPVAERVPARIAEIQGAAHVSPLVGRCVRGVEGTVTAILGQRNGQAFWLQSAPDGDPATSEGLFVTALDGLDEIAIGDGIRVTGRVEEPAWRMELPVTRLVADGLEILERGSELPPPVVLGMAGREIPPRHIDDDGLTLFEPETDAIDFFESLEGMRVRVQDPVAVGPTSKHGEIVVLGDSGTASGNRSGRGGVVKRSDDVHPDRIIVDDRLVHDPPPVAVGQFFIGAIDGVLHYSYGSFKLINTARFEFASSLERPTPATTLKADDDHITAATFNVENLHRASHEGKFAALADVVVTRLGSPTVLAVQEIQDDSGPEDDGTVSAERTLERLVASIEAAGGPRYRWTQIDPENNADGGRPGGNIRVALLFDPARASLPVPAETEPEANPVRLGVEDPAFTDSRKPLVAELEVDGHRIFFVVCHLRSKGGDDPLFGRRQPPVRASERQRVPQARLVRSWVAERLASDPGARIVILGDLNDFEFSDAVGILGADPMVNLMDRLPAPERSTYVYLGNSQTLDHIIVSPALGASAEIQVLHVNSDFPASERASDHDPVIARFITAN
jgi:hypothetical protein